MDTAHRHEVPLHRDQVLVLRPVARFAKRGAARWTVAIGPKTRELRGSTADRLLPVLAAALDGRRALDAAVECLCARGGVSPAVARASLELLYRWEILDDAAGYRVKPGRPGLAPSAVRAAQERFFALMSSQPARNQERLDETKVAVFAEGAAPAALLGALQVSGLRVVSGAGASLVRAELAIAWFAGLESEALRALNRESIQRGVPLLVANPGRRLAFVGPTVFPGQSACVECALDHFAGNGLAEVGRTEHAARDQVLGHLAALEALRVTTPCLRPGLIGARCGYEVGRHQLHRVEIVRRPRCPVCGDLAGHSPAGAFQERGTGRYEARQ